MTLKQFLRQDFNTKIRPFLIKPTCEVCGSETEQLHVHHVTYFQDLLNETLAELQLEFHNEDYEQHYTENQLEMIRNIMLGKQMRIEYVTCCESCHLELHEGSYSRDEPREWSEKMVAIHKERKRVRELQEKKRLRQEVEPYLESLVDVRLDKEGRSELVEKLDFKVNRRLVKSAKSINAILEEMGIHYEITTKKVGRQKTTVWIVVSK